VFTNVRELSGLAGLGAVRWLAYAAVAAIWTAAIARPRFTADPVVAALEPPAEPAAA
jgi:hypothetical protein